MFANKTTINALLLLLFMGGFAAAQDAGFYKTGATTIVRAEAEPTQNNFLPYSLGLRVNDASDCSTLANGEAWNDLCEYTEKRGGSVLLTGNLVGQSGSLYAGRLIGPAGEFWLQSNVLVTENAHFLRLAKPGGALGAPIEISGNRGAADQVAQASQPLTARRFADGADFRLRLGQVTNGRREAELVLSSTDPDICAALIPGTSGWKQLCELTDKIANPLFLNGTIRADQGAEVGILSDGAGRSFNLWVRDARPDYALVAIRGESEWPFSGGQPAEAVIFSGREDVAPKLPAGAAATTAYLVGIDANAILELGQPRDEGKGDETSVTLTMNAAARGTQNLDECMRLMQAATNRPAHMLGLCARAATEAPATFTGTAVPFASANNTLKGVVEDGNGTKYNIQIRNFRDDYAEVAIVSASDPTFTRDRFSWIPFGNTADDLRAQQPSITFAGQWTVEFGPTLTFEIAETNDRALSGTLAISAYSDTFPCGTRGGLGSGVAYICDTASKDGGAQLTLNGQRRTGPAQIGDLETNTELAFQIATGLSAPDGRGLQKDALYVRFLSNWLEQPTEKATWHRLQPGGGTPPPAPALPPAPAPQSGLKNPPVNSDLLGRWSTSFGTAIDLEITPRGNDFLMVALTANGGAGDCLGAGGGGSSLKWLCEEIAQKGKVEFTLVGSPDFGVQGQWGFAPETSPGIAGLQPVRINITRGDAITGSRIYDASSFFIRFNHDARLVPQVEAKWHALTKGSSQPTPAPSEEIQLINSNGASFVIVPPSRCASRSDFFCQVAGRGPAEGWRVDNLAISPSHVFGTLDIAGQTFVMRAFSEQGQRIFDFYSSHGLSRFE